MDAFEEKLIGVGANPDRITPLQKSALDQKGYVVIPGQVPDSWLLELRRLFDRRPESALEPVSESSTTHSPRLVTKSDTGTQHVGGLDKNKLAVRVCTLPIVLAAAYYLLKRPFRISMMHGRDPLPGFGQQGLHRDWHAPKPGSIEIVTGIIALDNFTAENGATRVVPGTHLDAAGRLDKRAADPAYVHSSQVVIEATLGSVLIFNGHLLHSATRNRGSQRRRTIQVSFVGFENKQRIMEEPPDLASLPPELRFLFE